jgi:hypothetical protein
MDLCIQLSSRRVNLKFCYLRSRWRLKSGVDVTTKNAVGSLPYVLWEVRVLSGRDVCMVRRSREFLVKLLLGVRGARAMPRSGHLSCRELASYSCMVATRRSRHNLRSRGHV